MPGRVYRSEHARRTAPADPGAAPSPAPEAPAEEQGSAAGHSAVMALGSLVSRLTGFLRTVVIAAALGSTVVGDAYTTAQWFPGMVYELLLGGILTSVLVPVLVRARKAEPDRGEAYTQRLVTLAVLALGATAVLAVAGAPLLVWVSRTDAPGLVTALSYLILPTIFFYGLAGVLTAVLNTRGHFAAPMWAPILNNLVVIGTFGLYLLVYGAERLTPEQMDAGRIGLIGGGTLLGIVVQAAGLLPALRRVGFRMRWRFDFAALRLRELGRLGAWMFCYVTVNQVSVLVVLSLINAGGAGAGLLIFNQVYLLLMMAHGIVGVSIIMALLPRMSAAAADRRYEDLVDDLSKGARMAAAVLAPIAVMYVVLALPIATTLFQWGIFDADASRATAPVLVMAGLALVPFSLSQLLMFAFYALPDTKTPALVNVGAVGLRIAVQLGIFLAFAASAVAAGMMLGNGISYLAAVLLLGVLLRRRLGPLGLRRIGSSLGRVAVAAAGAAVAGLLVLWLLPGDAEPTKLGAAVQLLAGAMAVGGVYLGLAALLRINEVNEVLALVRSKIFRG
ncbi:MAG: murein biosynthesis integral membrane protein MurJ [Micromonosporaceae bacterium]|nr:murein biosynthesis integral membrane protein MurJ [Micromonosporaceae bacterium]